MTVVIKSSTDSDETVKAALGDLATPKPVDDKPIEEKPLDPVEEPKEVPAEAEPEEPQEEAEEEKPEELEAKTDEDPKPPKKKGGFQKKIVKLEQEKEYWREQALRSQSQPKPEAIITKDQSLRPKATDFANHDDYVEALVDWKADQKIQTARQKEREDKVKTDVQAKFNTHHERVNTFKETIDDFDEVLENVSTIPMSLAVQESILDSIHGPEMMYALANDPKEFKRLCNLPPLQAAREMGKLESKFIKTATTTSETKTTRAPKPVTPVRTRGASVPKDLNDPSLSYEDYKRIRNEQIKQRTVMRR